MTEFDIHQIISGLFHQAMLQSGSEYSMWAFNQPSQQPEDYTRQIAEDVNCPTEDSQEMVECLQSILPRMLINAEFSCTVS